MKKKDKKVFAASMKDVIYLFIFFLGQDEGIVVIPTALLKFHYFRNVLNVADERFSNAWQQLPASCQLFSIFVFPPKVGRWGVGGLGGGVHSESRTSDARACVSDRQQSPSCRAQLSDHSESFFGCLPAKALPKGPPLTFNCTFPSALKCQG